MRFLLLLFTVFLLSATAAAQNQREVGVRSTGINQFSLLYKRQLDNRDFIRYRLLAINVTLLAGGDNSRSFFNTGIAVGLEKRKPLSDRLSLLRGFEPFVTIGLNTGNDVTVYNLGLGLGYVLGFQYELSEGFFIAVETIPSASFGLLGTGNDTVFTARAGFNNNSLALTGVYRFNKM